MVDIIRHQAPCRLLLGRQETPLWLYLHVSTLVAGRQMERGGQDRRLSQPLRTHFTVNTVFALCFLSFFFGGNSYSFSPFLCIGESLPLFVVSDVFFTLTPDLLPQFLSLSLLPGQIHEQRRKKATSRFLNKIVYLAQRAVERKDSSFFRAGFKSVGDCLPSSTRYAWKKHRQIFPFNTKIINEFR